MKALPDWKENSQTAKWLFDIGKLYVFGFLVINLFTMGISLISSIAGRHVVDDMMEVKNHMVLRGERR